MFERTDRFHSSDLSDPIDKISAVILAFELNCHIVIADGYTLGFDRIVTAFLFDDINDLICIRIALGVDDQNLRCFQERKFGKYDDDYRQEYRKHHCKAAYTGSAHDAAGN